MYFLDVHALKRDLAANSLPQSSIFAYLLLTLLPSTVPMRSAWKG
jgi:hypothetical protein